MRLEFGNGPRQLGTARRLFPLKKRQLLCHGLQHLPIPNALTFLRMRQALRERHRRRMLFILNGVTHGEKIASYGVNLHRERRTVFITVLFQSSGERFGKFPAECRLTSTLRKRTNEQHQQQNDD